jgi:hypothetical protein
MPPGTERPGGPAARPAPARQESDGRSKRGQVALRSVAGGRRGLEPGAGAGLPFGPPADLSAPSWEARPADLSRPALGVTPKARQRFWYLNQL